MNVLENKNISTTPHYFWKPDFLKQFELVDENYYETELFKTSLNILLCYKIKWALDKNKQGWITIGRDNTPPTKHI